MKRINVMGNTCSGKTTVAGLLSADLAVPHVELDSLYWQPDWTPAEVARFRDSVDEATRSDSWVVDGNYSVSRDIVWDRADTIVWIDLPLPLLLGRVAARTARRVRIGEELWNGNRETIGKALGRESLFVWVVKIQKLRRLQYPEWLTRPEYSHLTAVRLRSPEAVERWLADAVLSRS